MPSSRYLAVVLLSSSLLVAAPAWAQDTVLVRGIVLSPAGSPLAGARVLVDGAITATADADGRFSLSLPPGNREFRVTHSAHVTLVARLEVDGDPGELLLQMQSALSVRAAVTVTGIRADTDVPVTKTDLDRERIEELSYGQDVPALLQATPSVTWYSDSGLGGNYSYFSLRGIQQTRINMTYDGAPLNDPAENAVYFNNFHDFLADIDSVQIQRGVGTSSVGAPSYGGSVNFASRSMPQAPGAEVRLDLGSYDTRRASVGGYTGRFGNGFAATARLSLSSTDGYRHHSGSSHRTFSGRGGWQGDRASLTLSGFLGNERSQMAFLAVEPEVLAVDRRFNPMDEQESDDFTQGFVQAQFARALGADGTLSASAYYNGANGYFLLWDDPVAQTQLLQYGIDQGFWGAMLSAAHDDGTLALSGGVHFNDYSGDHTLDAGDARLYVNTGLKQTLNAFAKAEWRFDRWLLFGDLQLRWAEFRYRGDIDLGSVDWTFFDPRFGARWFATENLSVYAALGRAQREPTRLDMLAGEDNATVEHDLEAVRPESVVDYELGVGYDSGRVSLQANLYAMEFRDEIALTGELSDIGLPLRRNVDASYRRGMELDLRWRPALQWTLLGNANLSHNRIREWTQYYDVYDIDGSWVSSEPIAYQEVRPLLSPEVVANASIEWHHGAATVAATGRWVGDSQLDNTDLEPFRIPAWATLDLRATVDLHGLWPGGSPSLDLFVNNVTDATSPYPSGYSYQYLVRDPSGSTSLAGQSYYYPLATRNAVLQLRLSF